MISNDYIFEIAIAVEKAKSMPEAGEAARMEPGDGPEAARR